MSDRTDRTVFGSALAELRLGEPTHAEGVTVLPLLSPAVLDDPPYVTLKQALALGAAKVSEVGESGRVGQIVVSNRLDKPILVLHGEILIGAKQNRTANLTVLLPPSADTAIPVSCVERGRWGYSAGRRDFAADDRTIFHEARRAMAEKVSLQMLADREAHADQGEVWARVSGKMRRMDVHSPSEAATHLFEAKQKEIEDICSKFDPCDGQIGVMVALGGRWRGLELFGHPRVLEWQQQKILRGYALDAIELAPDRRKQAAPTAGAARLIEQLGGVAAERCESVGLGEHWRIGGRGSRQSAGGVSPDGTIVFDGGLLSWEGRTVHACAFPR